MAQKSLTVEDIATECGINLIQLEEKIPGGPKLLQLVDCCDPVSFVGCALGLSESDISAIKNDNKTTQEQRLAVLQKWKSTSLNATYKTFIEALLLCKKNNDARSICQKLADEKAACAGNYVKNKLGYEARKSVEKAESKSLQPTREVPNEREQLEVVIQGLQVQVKVGMNKMNSLRKEMDILEQHKDAIEANKDFEYEVEEEKMELVHMTQDNRWYVTNCLVCNFTCHSRCQYSNDKDKKKCSAMNSSTGYCKVCPGNCYWGEHRNNDFYYTQVTVTVKKTYHEMQKKYQDAQGEKSHSETIVEGLQKDLQDVRKKVFTMIIQMHQCIERLEEIALKPNPLTQVKYIDILIESEKQQAKKDWEKRVKCLQEARQQAVFISNFTGKKDSTIDPQLEALLDADSVEMLISSEKKNKKEGWESRVQQYEQIKERLSKGETDNPAACKTQ